jgi:membrane protein
MHPGRDSTPMLSHGAAHRMKGKLGTLLKWLDDLIWRAPAAARPRVQAVLLRVARVVIVLARDLMQGQLTLRAMGLVYTTLLSLVPLLAISFSVLKAFGVSDQIRPMLQGFLEPLGDKGAEITTRITGFIENINVGVLGSVGLAMLLYTSVSLMQKIEESFNYIWHVSHARSFGERFTRYVSALLVGPLLVFSAVGLTAAATSSDLAQAAMQYPLIGWLMTQAGQLLPYALVILAFTFLYSFMPNTRVRLWPALGGAVVGGIVWQTAGWAFAQFAAGSTKYSAIYSSFAILLIFMLWLYLSWLILLFGASVAFYLQHPEYVVRKGGEPRLSNRLRERLALVLMSMIGRHHLEGRAPWTTDALAHALRLPIRVIEGVLGALHACGVLATTGDEPSGWLPARDVGMISAKELLDAVRSSGENRYLNAATLPAPKAVEQLLQRFDEATSSVLNDVSVKDLAAPLSERPAGDTDRDVV